MNEQIKELVKQVAPSFGENQKWAIVGEADIEKFAELIVQECAQVVEEARWMVPPSQEQIARSIKRHFGVE